MDHFTYINNELHAEQVAISKISQEVGTPFYCYSSATLTRHYNVFAKAFASVNSQICFAVKSNSNLAVLKTLANLGSGGDCVSEGEIRRCLAAGIKPEKIIFSGVGKSKEEMAFALKSGIMQINVESQEELLSLNEVAKALEIQAKIAFRVNPDIDAGSHNKISTGRKEDKFGISWEQAEEIYNQAATLDHIHIQGIAVHIGSQLTTLEPFKNAFTKISNLVTTLRQQGHQITHLDLGGGLGIPYSDSTLPTPEEYAKMTIDITKILDCHLSFEPGRIICGNAGILVAKTIFLKRTTHKNFLIIDAGMNDLLRPSLYEAHHEIIPVKQQPSTLTMDIVGPICETGDIFAKDRKLPDLQTNDLIAIRSCGAYGAVMSSEYNSRPLIPEVMVHEDQFAIIRNRPEYSEILTRDLIPNWLT